MQEDGTAGSDDAATGEPETIPSGTGECLTPDDCLSYLVGAADGPPADRAQRHMDECASCRVMMAEAVRATISIDSAVPGRVFRTLSDGERVAARYEIKRFVARGGMGEVYEAIDTVLQERVALKTLAVTASDQGDAVDGLLREVRMARKVTHPNVCRILELGVHRRPEKEFDAVPFLTMEFLTGETLAQRLARVGRLPPSDVIRLARELAAGLTAVHQAGIVHRDFKTENIFLVRNADETERTVVMDFGLARVFEGSLGRRSSNGRLLVGTPAYMAPEQLTGRPATPATDVYALGIVIFEMLTGRLPFSGDSMAVVALSRLHQAAPAPSSLVPGLGPAWDDLIGRCLEREPNRRFVSIGALVGVLERVAQGNLRKGRARWPVVVGVSGLALAALTLAAAGSASLRRVAPPRSEAIVETSSSSSVPGHVPVPVSVAVHPEADPVLLQNVGDRITGWPSGRETTSPSNQNPRMVPSRAHSVLVPPRTRGLSANVTVVRPNPGPTNPDLGVPAAVGPDVFAPPTRARPRHADDLADPF